MPKYRLYLLNGGKVPRTTLYNRRKVQQRRAALQEGVNLQRRGTRNSTDYENGALEDEYNVGDSERSSCSYVSYDGSTSSSNSDCDVPSTAVREGQRRRKKRKSYKEPPCQYRKDISQPDTSEECSGGISSDGSYSYSSQGSQGLNHSWSSVSAPPTPLGMQSTLSPCHSPTNVESQNPRSVPPESDDDDPFNKQYFEKLCPCTDVTAGDVIFMTLALGCRHGLTWAAQNDILRAFQSISGKRFPQKIQSVQEF
ncbi:uncharacterized protein LOC124172589 [Ischnura elegans]|uniref:uncharacterized protein LOC124172589 n=1 Tax=Ischnura elegans TaxID=197161 RepID=UPI001ED8ABC1|nr:uncharacterized protein LOC124172589 [Ischnura elegans]